MVLYHLYFIGMQKKYKLTKDYIRYGEQGIRCYRICACKSFTTLDATVVHAGDLGGYVQGERNLSQIGNCWLSGENVVCYGTARISGDALVKAEHNEVLTVHDGAVIKNSARVLGHVQVFEATVADDAIVDASSPGDFICLTQGSNVHGTAVVQGNAWISNTVLDGEQ